MIGQKLHVLPDKKAKLFIMVTRKLLRIIRRFEKSWITNFNLLQQQYCESNIQIDKAGKN